MRIKETNRPGPVGSKKAASKAADDGRFAAMLDSEGTAETGSAATAAPAGAMGGLLSLQEVDDPAGRASRGRQRAETILDRLDALRHALLTGDVPVAELGRINAAIQRQRESIDDPKLTAILDEIDLRAQVEMAKYGVDPTA